MKGVLYRSIPVSVRSINEDKRTAVFVASTENPVDTFWGREVLRMSGVDLTRFRAGGPFLDSHDGSTVENVLGSGSARVVGRELEFEARFDVEDGGKGELAWGKVQRGHVRTVSIGYRVDPTSVRRLKEGDTDGQGEAQVRGPAVVVNRWELLEVSLVPVPADRDAVLRSALLNDNAALDQRQEGHVANDHAAERKTDAGNKGESVYSQAVTTQTASSALTFTTAEDMDLTRARRIRELAGTRFADLGDQLVFSGVSFEAARAALLAATVERSKPLGTPEPKTTTTTKTEWPAEITDEVLLRSLRNLS